MSNRGSGGRSSGESTALRAPHLVVILMVASAPIMVLATTAPATIRASGVAGIPLIFLLFAVMLVSFGFASGAMSRHGVRPGGLYAQVSRGLGAGAGLGAAAISTLAYQAKLIALHGLLGAATAGLVEARTGLVVPWWLPALAAVAAVGALGARSLRAALGIGAVFLVVQVAVVLAVGLTAVFDPGPRGIDTAPFDPAGLLGGSIGVTVCFTFAAWVGVEAGAAYRDELGAPRRAVRRATFVVVTGLGLVYGVSAWTTVGLAGPAEAGRTAQPRGAGLVPPPVVERFGPVADDLFAGLVIVSLFLALLVFHHTSARHLAVLAADGVIPAPLGARNARSGAPVRASVAQAAVAGVAVVGFAVGGADPVLTVFGWSANLGALGVLFLLSVASLAVIVFFLRTDYQDSGFLGWEGPVVAAFFALTTFGFMFVLSFAGFDRLVGAPAGSLQGWLPPALIPLLFVGGLVAVPMARIVWPAIAARAERADATTDPDHHLDDDGEWQTTVPSLPHSTGAAVDWFTSAPVGLPRGLSAPAGLLGRDLDGGLSPWLGPTISPPGVEYDAAAGAYDLTRGRSGWAATAPETPASPGRPGAPGRSGTPGPLSGQFDTGAA